MVESEKPEYLRCRIKTDLIKKVLPVQVYISIGEVRLCHRGQIESYYDVRKSNMAAGKPEVLITL